MTDITHPRIFGAANPLGIERARFAWEFGNYLGAPRNDIQTAYQVQVASTLELLVAGAPDRWDSAKVRSSAVTDIPYAGVPLRSGERAWWRVRVWDARDAPGGYSDPAWFEMGLLAPDDWRAEWIGFPAGAPGKPLYIRHAFDLPADVVSARIYAAGLGYCELRANGHTLDDRVLDPAPTDYAQRVLYSTYDVTGLLQRGENVIGAIVAAGWYGVPKLLLQARIELASGETRWILTGRQGQGGAWWRVAQGPIQSASVYDGETCDARLEQPGWDRPGFHQPADEFTVWSGGMRVEAPGGRLVAQMVEPIRVVDTLSPEAVNEPRLGVYVFDFGQNMAGWARLAVQGPAGTRVTLRFAESLYDDGTVNQENLRSARATDEYVLKGDPAGETWEPRFTYHGFRYVQVAGLPQPPTTDTLLARVVRSGVERASNFACSNDLLNRIAGAVRWTEGSNLHGVPTDCPQRDERMGWLNDLAARTEEALCNFDLSSLFAKFSADVQDAQDPATGAISDTAPFRWGARPADPVSVAYLLIPWQLYRWYGDRGVLADRYDSMRRWVDYLLGRAQDDILGYSYYGDWAPPITETVSPTSAVSAHTPGELVSTAFMAYHARLLSQIAAVLGKPDDAACYAARSAHITRAYHTRFWDESAGGYGTNNQACNALSLYMDLAPAELRGRVLESLVRDVEAHGYHLTTGNLCTKYLLEVLSDSGRGDIAYRIATQTTYPSWGYMLANGATTIWERWEKATGGGMNSHSHPMLASVGSWLIKYVAGIDQEPGSVAFSRIRIAPRVTGEITSANADLLTVQGRISAAWTISGNTFNLIYAIPGNCRARIELPVDPHCRAWKLDEATTGAHFVSDQPLAADTDLRVDPQIEQSRIIVEAGSGSGILSLAMMP